MTNLPWDLSVLTNLKELDLSMNLYTQVRHASCLRLLVENGLGLYDLRGEARELCPNRKCLVPDAIIAGAH